MTQIISNLEVTQLVVDHPIGADNPPLLYPPSDDERQTLLTQHELQFSDFDVDWQNKLTDKQLDTFVDDGWMIIDDMFENKAGLRKTSLQATIIYKVSMRLLLYSIKACLLVFAIVRHITLVIRLVLAINGIAIIRLDVMSALSRRCFISMMIGVIVTVAL